MHSSKHSLGLLRPRASHHNDRVSKSVERTSSHSIHSHHKHSHWDDDDEDVDTAKADEKNLNEDPNITFTAVGEKIHQLTTKADAFAATHSYHVHVICIWVAVCTIPVSMLAIVWDLMAALVFQYPELSTINAPAFVLFFNFVAIPLAIYGYMMEYLIHENSRLSRIGLFSVVVNPILFLIRALMEYFFDGFRGENKIYFESFTNQGQEDIYPIGTVRYKQGDPYSDSSEGRAIIKEYAHKNEFNHLMTDVYTPVDYTDEN